MDHNEQIKEEFTKQAATFGKMPGHYEALDWIVAMTQACSEDTVLDVACGPGIVAAAFAPKVKSVKGIDLVPAMIDKAKAMQQEKGYPNMSWDIGNAQPLPYDTASFSIVVSRFAFHHLVDPSAVLNEMARVAKWGGRVCVVDVFTCDEEQGRLYNDLEKLRDPSHVRALGLNELEALFVQSGLNGIERRQYRMEVDVEELLKASFTPPDAAARFRSLVEADIGKDNLGIMAAVKAGRLVFHFPIIILAAQKAVPDNYGISCCGDL